MKKPVPTLSAAGWVSDPREAADKLFSYFVATDGNQSDLYRGKLVSFSEVLAKYGMDNELLRTHTTTAIDALFTRHFDDVDVTITIEEEDGLSNVIFTIEFTSGNVRYDLGNSVEFSDTNTFKLSGA